MSLDKIKHRYNPENDTRPDGPAVPWDVMELVYAIEQLETRLAAIENQTQGETVFCKVTED